MWVAIHNQCMGLLFSIFLWFNIRQALYYELAIVSNPMTWDEAEIYGLSPINSTSVIVCNDIYDCSTSLCELRNANYTNISVSPFGPHVNCGFSESEILERGLHDRSIYDACIILMWVWIGAMVLFLISCNVCWLYAIFNRSLKKYMLYVNVMLFVCMKLV